MMAMRLLAKAADNGVVPDNISFSIVIGICGECQRLDLALKVFNCVHHSNAIERFGNILIEYLLENPFFHIIGNSSSTSILRCEMVNEVQMSNDFEIPVYYNKSAPTSALAIDTGTYNAMILACEKCNQPEIAISLIEEMVRSTNTSNPSAVESPFAIAPKPDVKSFGAAITACGNAKRIDQVMRLFYLMDYIGD